jgi:uncharacterized protein YuzE
VLVNPRFVFYDLLSRAFVAVSEVGVEGVKTNLVVVYVRGDNVIRVVTVYPCRRIDREIERKGGFWEMGKGKVKIWYDEESDILYISFGKGVAVDSEEVDEGVRVEYDEGGKLVGVEISNAREKLLKQIAKLISREIGA